MPIRANILGSYLARLGIVTVAMFGFTLWCLYDGMIAWPAQAKYAQALLDLEEEHKEQEDLTLEEKVSQKEKLAAEHGWPPPSKVDPGEPYSPGKIQGQFAMAALPLPFGFFFLYLLLKKRGRWVEASQSGITTSQKDDFTYDQIVELNKRQWKKKGIARVIYDAGAGRKKVVLDDCYFERVPTVKILRHIEDSIPHKKITNGKPEPPLGEDLEAPGEELATN